MGEKSRWDKYPLTYREEEMKRIAAWIQNGESGAVVGLPGTGRATLLTVLCHRPEIVKQYLQDQNQSVVLIPVDLNNLPSNDLATLYRVILRSIYENRIQFNESLQELISNIYEKYQSAQDPFLPQSGLRELFLRSEANEQKVVLVMNRFDYFCKNADPQMTLTLRGLRDSFKETLCYIMGMRQEVAYLSDLPSVGPLYSILDTHVFWVGPLSRNDAKDMIERELRVEVAKDSLEILLSLTGGYPSLIRVVCHWWEKTAEKQQFTDWKIWLIDQKNVEHRMDGLFGSLTSAEETLLREQVRKQKSKNGKNPLSGLTSQEQDILNSLILKGICKKTNSTWSIGAALVATYISHSAGISRGRVWQDEHTGEFMQGRQTLSDLTPLERKVLVLFIEKPRYLYTYTELAEGAWLEEEKMIDGDVQGVSNETIQQAISGLRKKIEPNSTKPRYIINWRGQPEGGYQFFPEGRPNQ